MPLTSADARRIRCPAAWLAAASIALLASACGDDSAGTVPTGARDAGDAAVEAGVDANVDPLPDVPQIDPDSNDANVPDTGPPPVPDAGTADAGDAGPEPTCDDVDCSTLDDECNVGMCVPDTLECITVRLDDGTACGSRVMDLCTQPDTCQAGVCVPNHRAAGRPCGDQGRICHNDDACDGNGNCVDMGLWAVGTACGDTTDSLCDNPDTCDSAGRCNDNLEPRGTGCGDVGVPCHNDDLCDGNGNCLEGGLVAADTLCGGAGEPPINSCHPVRSRCDASGNCLNSDLGDGTPCGDQTDDACDNPNSCLNGFCANNYEARGTACGSGSSGVCDNPDSCNGFGDCAPNHEPNGTVCGVQSDPCVLPDACDMGVCASAGNVMNGMACGDDSWTECDQPDSCRNGACDPNYIAAGADCGDQDMECHVDDACDGSGSCMDNGFASAGSPCGDQGMACHINDECDSGGNCIDNGLASPGTPCGDPTNGGICNGPDTCDAAGACQSNVANAGVVCGDDAVTCFTPDTCDGAGTCDDNGFVVGCRRVATGVVTDNSQAPIEGATVTVLGISAPDTAVSAADGTFSLEVPMGESFLLHATGGGARWNSIEGRLVDETLDLGSIALTDDSFIAGIFTSVAGHDPADTTKGIVIFDFDGHSGLGGETGTQSAASATPETPITFGPGGWVSSTSLVMGGNDFLVFGNTEVGNTAVDASGAPGTNTCVLRHPSLATRPVIAHTTSWIQVDCTPL